MLTNRFFIGWLTGCAVIWASDQPIVIELVAALFAAAAVILALTYLRPHQTGGVEG